jgi:hypothetical protein
LEEKGVTLNFDSTEPTAPRSAAIWLSTCRRIADGKLSPGARIAVSIRPHRIVLVSTQQSTRLRTIYQETARRLRRGQRAEE